MNIEENKIPIEEPVELVSLDEMQEEIEACFCSNCGAEIAVGYSPDDWGLCQECNAELEPPVENPEDELNFNN